MLLPVFGLAISGSAGATSWDTITTGISLTSAGASIYCGSGGAVCNTTGTGLTGTVMTMRAYSTPTLNSVANTSNNDTGNWINAQLAIYAGAGTGISNTLQGATDQGTPQHAIDNYGATDILVIDFGSANWDVSSFSLGYTCNMGTSSGSSCSGGSTVNVEAWVGGTSAINFNTAAFSGSATGASITGTGATFSELTLTNDPGGTGVRTDISNPTNKLGRYLVITGDLSSYSDSFKVSGVVATQSTGVPLPGTAPLFMLGLLALGYASRRRRPMAIRAAA